MNNRKARLQAFAPKICYEAEMFVALADLWPRLPSASDPPQLCNYGTQPCAMIASTCTVRWNGPAPTGEAEADQNQVVRHAVLEAFLLHFRCLSDFLLWQGPEEKRKGRMLASAFLTGQAKEQWQSEVREYRGRVQIEKWCGQVNRHLAHLSEERADLHIDWPIRSMRNAVIDLLHLFLKHLPKEMKPWFGKLNQQR